MGETSYGMGLFIETYRGHKHVQHGGNLDGFSLMLSFLPNDGIGVVVLTNLDGTPLRNLIPYVVYDRLLGLDSIDWVQRFREIELKARDQELSADKKGYTGRKEGTRPSHDLAEYAGEFEHPGYGKLAIRVEGTGDARKLYLKLNDVERPLEHFHYDTFQVPENPLDPFEKLRVTLPTDAQGELSKVEANLEANVKEIVFKRVAEKRMFETSVSPAVHRRLRQPGTTDDGGPGRREDVAARFPGTPTEEADPKAWDAVRRGRADRRDSRIQAGRLRTGTGGGDLHARLSVCRAAEEVSLGRVHLFFWPLSRSLPRCAHFMQGWPRSSSSVRDVFLMSFEFFTTYPSGVNVCSGEGIPDSPQVLLGIGPRRKRKIPPFMISKCVIQGLSKACPLRLTD